MPIRVAISTHRANKLRERGVPVPPPLDVAALLDTGSDCTLIDPSIAVKLHLPPRNRVIVRSLDTKDGEQWRYAFDANLVFTSDKATSHAFTIQIAGLNFSDELPYRAIIGRDLLRSCTFHYDGPDAEVTLNI